MKLMNSKTYALVTGVVLFALGFFGFAFKSAFDVPNHYLITSLILGFWGVVVAVGNRA